MKVNITGKNITVTQAIADKINKKLAILNKYFIIDDEDTANVLIRTYPDKQKIEVTIPTRFAILRTEVADDDLYSEAFIDVELYEDAPMDEDEVVRTKSIVPAFMSLDEAIAKMELLDHDFFIYTDDETRKIAVVYRRREGGYGLIETE